jgi:uncharacterized protein YjbJ (UPF0337 family)
VVNKDRMEGAGREAGGKMKQAAGKATDNTRTQAEGAAEKTAGKAQKAVGKAEDRVRKH